MRGLHLMRIAGIDVTVDWSPLIIFALITFSLAAGLFPQWHPAWSPATSWLTALAAAALFFASVLAHEALSFPGGPRERDSDQADHAFRLRRDGADGARARPLAGGALDGNRGADHGPRHRIPVCARGQQRRFGWSNRSGEQCGGSPAASRQPRSRPHAPPLAGADQHRAGRVQSGT